MKQSASDAVKAPEHAASVPAQLTDQSKQTKTGSEQVTDTTKPVSASDTGHVNAAQNESIKLVIPEGVKPMPIDLIDNLIRQKYNRAGIESILKASKLSVNRKLISERMKAVRPSVTDASTDATKNPTTPITESEHVTTQSGHVNSESEHVISSPTTDATTHASSSSTKTPENTGNSGISSENVVAQLLAQLTAQPNGGSGHVVTPPEM
jgi:hypothetical protein